MSARSGQSKEEKEQRSFNDISVLENEAQHCEHMMDSLDFIDWEYNGDQVVCLYRCSCGKKVTEVFSRRETRISD